MNLLCPNCQKMLSVPEQFAGQMMKCPTCTSTFTVPPPPPGGFSPAPPSPALGFPGVAPSAAPAQGAELAAPPTPRPPRAFSLTLRLPVVNIVAPLALFVVFVLMFFPWLESGLAVKDSSLNTFTGWQTAFGEYSSGLGMMHALLLILTLLAAVAAALVPYLPLTALPPATHRFVPLVPLPVGGLVLLCFLLLALQLSVGFGPEQDPQKIIGGVLASGQEVVLNFNHAGALRLAVFCEILAIVGCALTTWLNLRAKQQMPLPRMDFTW